MSELQRLLDDERVDPELHQMLDAAANARPAQNRSALYAALGVAAASTTASTAAAVGAGAALAPVMAPAPVAVGGAALAKWLLGATLVAGAAGGGYAHWRSPASAPPGAEASAHHEALEPRPAPAPTELLSDSPPLAASEPPPQRQRAWPAPALQAPVPAVAEPPAAPTVAPAASVVTAELEALDELRALSQAKRDGDLVQYAHKYLAHSQGLFAPEATVLMVESLMRLGQTAEARAAGEGFLASHPQGTLARRMENALRQSIEK